MMGNRPKVFSKSKNKFLISASIESERLIDFTSGSDIVYGKAHYSWKISAKLYKKGLHYSSVETKDILRPEIYRTEIARKVACIDENDVHLCVKPIEHIRKLPGVKNICVAGWEFPEFSDYGYENNPFNNYISVLSKTMEVWCWSNFTTNNLRENGLNNVITFPPPVLLGVYSGINSGILDSITGVTYGSTRGNGNIPLDLFLSLNKEKTIFIAVINPGDRRKQTKLMIEAFLEAQKYNSNIVLIIKLIIDNVTVTLENASDFINNFHGLEGSSEKIFLIGDVLTDEQMISLIGLSKFYLCTSSTEGLNLPIIEAMGQGVVPISISETAMKDYINTENALVLDSDQVNTTGSYHMLHEYIETTHFPPRLYSIICKILEAGAMSNDTYRGMSENAIQKVNELYSLDSFKLRIDEYLG